MLDVMASNGDQNTPRLQKVFWAVVEGATASALLIAGGSDALSAVQVFKYHLCKVLFLI